MRKLVPRLETAPCDEDPEEIHRARVAVRRLRSTLRTFRPLFDDAFACELNRELRWLGSQLGTVRDTDIAMMTLADLSIDGDGADELVGVLTHHRHMAARELLADVETQRAGALVRVLGTAAADPQTTPAAQGEALAVLGPFVSKRWRRVTRAEAALEDDPPIAELHAIRILTKRCRYAAEVLIPVAAEEAENFARRLAQLQDSLGALNDAHVVASRLRRLAPGLTPSGAFAAGQAVCALTARAEQERAKWRNAWDAASAKKLRAWLP